MTIQLQQRHSKILRNADTNISMKFGFLGLGMGGTSIAAACADTQTDIQNNRYPYTSLLINTNQIDLDKIEQVNPNTKKKLIGDGRGAGRNINIGENLFVQSRDSILEEIKNSFGDRDFIWVVAGLGGGTGTGSVIKAIELLYNNGFKKKFGLILTLPRLNEGHTVIDNALQRLQLIHQAMNGLGSIILVDNEKLYNYFKKNSSTSSVGEYLSFSNRFVAETLHELNAVTASFKPVGENHFDSSEFENLIKTAGILHLVRFTIKAQDIDTAQSLSYIGKLKEQIEHGVLSHGYDLGRTTRLAVSVLANQSGSTRLFNFDFDSAIESLINQIAPIANEKPIAQYTYQSKDTRDVHFFAAFAGLGLPERAKELVQENQRLIDLKESVSQKEDDIFAGFSSSSNKASSQEQNDHSFEDLFGANKNQKTEESTVEDNMKAFFES